MGASMRKTIGVIAIVAVLAFSGVAFAQMNEKGMGQGMGMMKGDMMDKDGMMGGKMGCSMMQHMMGGSSMVATSDGGVVVLSGCTLTKYDKNLKEVKEVQLKCEMMKKGCPMMHGGKMGMMNDNDADDKVEAAGSQEQTDHASHH